METDYESGISALNRLLKLWFDASQAGYFRGKSNVLKYVPQESKELHSKLAPIIRSINYLEWLCKEVSLHNVSMEMTKSEVTFKILDKNEYHRYKLPFIRETARMQNALRSFPHIKEFFKWKNEEINYSSIVEVKESGDDFRLKIDHKSFMEAYKRATEKAYQSHLLIMEDMYIEDLHKLEIKINL